MNKRSHLVLLLIGNLVGWLAALTSPALATAASPRLSSILPRGIQRGHEHELTFHGSRLADVQEIFFYEPGLQAKQITADGNGALKVTVEVAADCRIGEHVAQVRTATGISDYRTLHVGSLAETTEAEPNSEFAQPQAVAVNTTITGVVDNEDVDHFVVTLSKGQRLTVEVQALRLGGPLFDPYIAIIDQRRFELASADDSPRYGQDAAISIVAPEDGPYVVQVRDSAYGGGGDYRYRLHLGHFPLPTAVYPAGGQVGTEIDLRLLGDPAGEGQQHVALPAEPNENFDLFVADDNGTAPTPISFRVIDQANTLETEPNNKLEEATAGAADTALNGIIDAPGDVDFFKFSLSKDQTFEIECYARRLGTPLDPVMRIRRTDGKHNKDNDDARGLDSYFRYTVPEEGEYVIQVWDKLGRGGPDYVYRVELQSVVPKLSLGIPRVERYGQYRQTISVPRGNRFATLINASRTDVGGDVTVDENQLPAGMSIHVEPMPGNLNEMPVVFEAAADAPVAGQLVEFAGRIKNDSGDVRGVFRNTADIVLGPPNNTAYLRRSVAKLAVAVVEEAPFRLELVQPNVPLVRNGSMQLKVLATRKEGFNAPIQVKFPFRPPGLGTVPEVSIGEGATEVEYPINANDGAQLRSWPIYAIGVSDAGGPVWVSTQLAQLEIAEPFVTFQIERVACERGQKVQVLCNVQQHHEFEGTAKVQLLGLPPNVTTTDLELTKDTEQLVFELQTTPESPVGKHKSPFCQVTITKSDEPILSNAGGFELQIDEPIPTETPAQPEPEQVAKEEAPKAKPLTRLEKLRLDAQARRE